MKKSNFKKKIFTPTNFFFGFCLLIYLWTQVPSSKIGAYDNKIDKIEVLYDILLQNYHDPITEDSLINSLINGLLINLDPFTRYIPREQLIRDQEDMDGDFYGIGVQFSILRDTVMVIKVLDNGPSKKANLLGGDRIIVVDGQNFTGEDINNDKVMNTLRGKRGEKVELTIFRKNKGEIKKTLYRDVIPLKSIESAYLIKSSIGYIKLDKFSATTHHELKEAILMLKDKGANKLILDLRNNGGGYLQQAVDVSNEFLEKNFEIVSTGGKYRKKQTYFSNKKGLFKKGDLVVLINENSASASEILAGAIQDNDRGYIVGNRSFGKGLVQEQFLLKNGAAFMVTVAKYYTPSGRSIQKPYNNIDSIPSKKFKTKEGRDVYAEGGIMPDYEIYRDTMSNFESDFWIKNNTILYEKAFDFADENREYINSENYELFLNKNQNQLWAKITRLSKSKLEKDSMMVFKKDLLPFFKRMVLNHILSTEEIIYFDNKDDEYLKKALKILLI